MTLAAAASLLLTVATALTAPVTAHADAAPSVTPSAGAAVGGYQTRVTITGTGFTAETTVTIGSCRDGSGTDVPGSGSVSTPSLQADGSLVVMLGPFAPSTCTVSTTTPTGGPVTAGTFTYTTSEVAYVTPVGVAPSILPIDQGSGGAAFLLSSGTVNGATGRGDLVGLTGAQGATLTCGTVAVPAAISPIGASPAAQATITPDATTFATVPAGTACDVTITLASGNSVDTSAVLPSGGAVWADSDVPSITLTPSSGAASQTTDQAQWVTASGTGLSTATAVQFAYCPASNPIATYPVATVKPAADGSSISFPVPDIPPASCSVLITLPAAGGRPAGYTVASVPPTGGFTFDPPYQGPITVTIANPHVDGQPVSGITDAELVVSMLADPTGGGTIDVAPTLNPSTLVSVDFTSLDGYDAAAHTGTMTFTPPLKSGNLYFSDADITGAPPNPLVSTVQYGFAEFTYDDAGLDVDFTMIDQIGLTMSQTLLAQDGTVIPGSYRDTGCLVDIVNALSLTGVDMGASSASTPGVMRYAGSAPASIPAPGQWTVDDLARTGWVGLIGASKSPSPYPAVGTYTSSVAGPLTITDNVGDPKYGGEFAYTATLSGGFWTLTGTVGGGPGGAGTTPGPTIRVEAAGLSGAGTKGGTGYGLYAQDGPFTVTLPDGTVIGWSNGSGLTGTGWTNVTKTIYRDFIAAFSYGYWGSAYGGGTSTGPNAVNFTRDPVTSAYATAQPTYPSAGQYAWNVYDQVIRTHSNIGFRGTPTPSGVYAMPYSDTFVPSDLSPNQQQGFAYGWNVTLGDPSGCDTNPAAALAPARQQVRVEAGVPVETSAYAASGFPGAVTYTVSPALPAGLALDPATGVVSGTPTVPLTATTYTVTGTSASTTATATIIVAVGADPSPVPTPAPACLPPDILFPDGTCGQIT